MDTNVQRGYTNVNGLEMYREIHGATHEPQRPLVLLHGGYQTIDEMRPLLPYLAETRQVIAVELEGHGRTVDLDRPLTYEQMAADVAGLIERLGVGSVDLVGYSVGGATALRLAMRYPQLVHKLVVISGIFNTAGYYPATTVGWPHMSAQALAGSPMEQAYLRTAPHAERWPGFVEKMKRLMMGFQGWSPEDIRQITAPTLILCGDADLVRPEHAIDLFRLLGGARDDGGMMGVPASQLAILPGVTHFTIVSRVDLLQPIITPFLDAPLG